MQEFVGDDDIIRSAIMAARIAIDDPDHAFLQPHRILEFDVRTRGVVADENPGVGLDAILVFRNATRPPAHLQRPEHDGQGIGFAAELGRLLLDCLPEFDSNRPRETAAVFAGLTRQERFDILKVTGHETLDVGCRLRAVVAVDRIDLDPEAVVPVRASCLGQPGADRDKEQYEQQD